MHPTGNGITHNAIYLLLLARAVLTHLRDFNEDPSGFAMLLVEHQGEPQNTKAHLFKAEPGHTQSEASRAIITQAMSEAARERKQVLDLTLLRCQPAPGSTDRYEQVAYTRRMTAPYQNLLERLTAPPKQLMDGVEEIPAMYKMAPVESAERYDGVRPQAGAGPHHPHGVGARRVR